MYSNSPAEFWLQSNDHSDAVMDISAQLAEHCNSSSKSPLSAPSVGQYCAALYNEDNAWYRAQVMSLSPSVAKVCCLCSDMSCYNTQSIMVDSSATALWKP